MNDFLDYIKAYLETEFANDSDIAKTVTVTKAYKTNNQISTTDTPQIQLQILNNAEVERYSSFEGENVSQIPLQITSYTTQMKIGESMVSAQEASIIFGDKIKAMLNHLRESVVNTNIGRCRIVSMSPALPLLEGSKVYTTAIRCEFWVANPYVVGE